jgi:nicotinate phosphoribosyltransferase
VPRRRKRIDPALFQLPVEELCRGQFSHGEGLIGAGTSLRAPVLMQVSALREGYLGGIDEAIATLKLCSDAWSDLAVHALAEGEHVERWDVVLTVEGPYGAFAHLESACVGILARRTRVTTNARAMVEAARPKPIILAGPGDDHVAMYAGDSAAAAAGGVSLTTISGSRAQLDLALVPAVPMSLVSLHGGDAASAGRALADALGADARILVPVDYANDAVRTSVEVARALEERLWGVLIATPDTMVDDSVIPQMGAWRPNGVNPQLVWNVRNGLDGEGFGAVQVVVSGGVDLERIQAFEEAGAAVDAYAVGAALHAGQWDYVAEVVRVEGEPRLRRGSAERPNGKLTRAS